ncbi:hypothetical protein BHE74_00020096 [Ensete ventricosum]|nr:hypothetical protein BHE74_00020096 [Ensete ventricosum]
MGPYWYRQYVGTPIRTGKCPYYISRELHKVVDILFAPYNYLIDPGNRRSLSGIQWNNAVFIFDEAHNLESICADAASFDLPSGYLTACISEAKQCVDLCIKRRVIEKSADKEFDPENYAILRAWYLSVPCVDMLGTAWYIPYWQLIDTLVWYEIANLGSKYP